MRYESWRSEVWQEPSTKVVSYCKTCNTWTHWRDAQVYINPLQAPNGVKGVQCTICHRTLVQRA